MLGKAKKVMIDKENTTIVNGLGKKEGHRRPSQIKAQIRNHLRLRPRLQNGWPLRGRA
jgi:hypothetical protein